MKKSTIKNIDELPIVLTVDDISNALGMCKIKVYELCHSRDFPSSILGRKIVIPKLAFVKWLENPNEFK
jgi:hypothetical protein